MSERYYNITFRCVACGVVDPSKAWHRAGTRIIFTHYCVVKR